MSGSVYRRPDGTWRAQWREVPQGPRRSKHFRRKVDADRFLAGVLADLDRGVYVDPRAGRVTFGEYGERWRTTQVHRPSTAAHVESVLRVHVYPAIGHRPLSSLRRSDLQALVKSLEATLAARTVETVWRYVVAILRSAVDDRLLATIPTGGVKLPKVTPARVVPLTVAEVEAIAGAVPDRYRALVVVGATTGLRQGELFGLTVDRLDLLRRTLTVDRQLVDGELAPLKTPASYRTVPLGDVTVDELARHLASYPVVQRLHHSGLVFVDGKGQPLRRNRFGEVWRRARAAAGIEHATTHDLRHFYASLLIRHGESVTTVQARLGHASASETLDTYSHLWPDSEDRTRAAIDEVFTVEPGERWRLTGD